LLGGRTLNQSNPLKKLAEYLELYHPEYSIHDVVLSPAKGYLQVIKPCNHNSWWCRGGFYHTIDISGVGYPKRDEKGRFISRYKLWEELYGLLPKANLTL